MSNCISLTIRLPHELNVQLNAILKEIGMTKTNLIRSAIHDFLTTNKYILDFNSGCSDKTDRIVLNINPLTRTILENACKKNSQTMNAMVVAVSFLALERSEKWLNSTKNNV